MIEFKHICLSFEKKTIFNDFNLKVEEGEKIIISGKSGKGKSTLLKILMGYADIESGQVIYKGKIIEGKEFNKLRHEFAYVNQDVSIENGKVGQVFEHIKSYKHNGLESKDKIKPNLFEIFELSEDLLSKEIEDLSGGERQRLGLILSIMLDRSVYLLDEVTSALDMELKEKTVAYFALCKKTVIVVSHDSVWFQSGAFRKVEW